MMLPGICTGTDIQIFLFYISQCGYQGSLGLLFPISGQLQGNIEIMSPPEKSTDRKYIG
jgi:hypothetical protein